ncbi:MAG: cytidylate kinase-like family protein [Oscillospiraceae bacterium]|nr:cytidylate kinase-like family protein [Oscillospiraceae bacterium]
MKTIITISREFGSGGRSIGKLVAEKLGYQFYDSEIVNEVAKRSGFAPEFIEEHGEYATARSSLLFTLATANQNGLQALSMHDKLYIEQTKIIEELAEKGNCVIVGRCADYVLRDHKDCLHVFIHADMDSRAKRIVERYGENDKSPAKRLAEKDQKRKVYYRNYTGRTWGQAQNYDLCLNSGVLGVIHCADIIVAACKE